MMKFQIISYKQNIVNGNKKTHYRQNVVLLTESKMEDTDGYRTTFSAEFCGEKGEKYKLGLVKIARCGMPSSRPIIDYCSNEFDSLPEGWFSLWQTAEAYKRVMQCERIFHFPILSAMNDIVYYPELYTKYRDEDVLKKSLFCKVSILLYRGQFKRIVAGKVMLTPYRFSYKIKNENPVVDDCSLAFSVKPNSLPPTNVHAIIGRNGTGKTTLIKHMIKSICEKDNTYGEFRYENGRFANVICISFNAFDDYSEVEYCSDISNFKYIGIKKEYGTEGSKHCYSETNLLDDIHNKYVASLKNCLFDVTKKDDLQDVLKILETEYNFMSSYYTFNLDFDDLPSIKDINHMETAFKTLSAGHKVVLSIIIRCIDDLVEKSIIFIDEPENHLHPPLLSALVRSISHIVKKRNGVAIISTHSPIVLQEIPKSCVWILNREDDIVNARRPGIETFGTNIGVLTNEIFGFEVKNTGFSTLLQKAVNEYDNYEEIKRVFNNQLGDEAKSIIRIMLKQKEMR